MDKGVEFVKGNFERALKVAQENTDLKHLLPKIKQEYSRIKDITKTGDMYEHFSKFSSGEHRYSSDFEIFKDYSVIRNEEMADILKQNFPDELSNKTEISDFKSGLKYTSHDISNIFKVSSRAGGIRVSNRTNTIVIISKLNNSLYYNKWIDNVLHYTGSGQSGDQSITSGLNKTLYQANQTNKTIHIFENTEGNTYLYHGVAINVGKPYTMQQPDVNNQNRTVYVFKLKLIDYDQPAAIEERIYASIEKQKEKSIVNYDRAKLKAQAEKASKETSSRMVVTKVIDRDPAVTEYVKLRANGLCDLCDQPAPFKTSVGEPYLECHHVKYLSKGGSDTIDNAVALCPNCHRKIHSLELKSDLKILHGKLKSYGM